MARKIPVATWITRHSPSNEPKFQASDRLFGAGRSTSDLLIAFASGCVLRSGVSI